MGAEPKLYLASSNPGKLAEFSAIAASARSPVELGLLPGYEKLAPFPEEASTFAENAVGKALHASALSADAVCADDSGLLVSALGGDPGVHSARYAGPGAGSAENIAKLLRALQSRAGASREARFVCVLAVARNRRVVAVVSNQVQGEILEAPRGAAGFGYDPVFYFPPARRTFAELSGEEKNLHSHRGKAFRRLLEVFPGML